MTAFGTDIFLLEGVPIDSNYKHVLYFRNTDEQFAYFQKRVKYRFNNQSYQRADKGTLRAEISYNAALQCNYVMFRNTSYSNKWFYAFLTGYTYINDGCTEISYEIDVMNTWLQEMTLSQCFIERCNVSDDTIGKHLLPEPVALSDYLYTGYKALPPDNNGVDALRIWGHDLAVIIAYADSADTTYIRPVDGVLSGLKLKAFAYSTPEAVDNIRAFLGQFATTPDAIVSIYVCPQDLLMETQASDLGVPAELVAGMDINQGLIHSHKHDFELPALNTSHSIDGYKPRNNKLYTYPYNYLEVYNNSGSTAYFRYEFFEGYKPTFTACGTVIQPVKVTLRPTHYKGIGDSQAAFSCIALENYPQCSYTNDTFITWLAQNSVPMVVNGLSAAGAAVAGNPMPALSYAQGMGMNLWSQAIAADSTHGSISNGNVNISNGLHHFSYARAHINAECAESIDRYFDVYGYNVSVIDNPNKKTRKYHKYVKTRDCLVRGDINAIDRRKIEEIYNAGFTTWYEPETVFLNYNVENPTLASGN